MKPGIATKITVLVIALVLVTAGAIGIMVFAGYDAILVSHELGNLGEEVRLEAVQLVAVIDALRHDVLFLSTTPPIQGLIRARAAGGVDPLDSSTEAEWRDRLAVIFTEFLRANPDYFQIRYIGVADEGRELMRLDRSVDTIARVADEDLQPKADTPYFQETIRMKPGQVYLSDITLNRVYGKVVETHVPTLRAAMPVHTSEGEVFGIVVINMDSAPVLEVAMHGQQRTLYISNDSGDFLAHPDPAMTFGFDLGERHRIQETYPELALFFEPGNSDREIAFRSEANDNVVHFLKVAFDPDRPDRFLGLAQAAPYEDIVAASTAVRNRSIFLTVLLIAGGAVLAFLFSRILTRPMSQITQAARSFAGGVLDAPLPVKANDEIGVLARAFSNMIQQVDERTEALRESEDRYRTLFELASDAILLVLPPEGEILDANEAAVKMLGYSKEELRKLNGGQIIAPEAVEETNREWSAQVENKGYFLLETIWVRKDGSRFPVSVSGKPLVVEDQAQIQLIGRDISERVQAEAERRKLSSAVEQTDDGVVITNREGVIQYVNPACEHITGYTKAELLGNTPRVVKSGAHSQEVYEQLWTIILAGETFRGTFINRKKDGELFHVDQTITPLKDAHGEITHFVSTWRDITEKVRAEEELRTHDQMMVRLVAISESLNRSFNVAEVVAAIGQGALALLHADRGSVTLRQPDDSITIPWAQGLSPAYLEQVPVQLQDLPGSKLLQQAEPILIPDVARLPEYPALRSLAQVEGYRAVSLWPLVYEGRMTAIVSCYHDESYIWSHVEQEVMQAFAPQAAVVLENARLFEKAQRRLEQVQALRNIDMAITASLDLRLTLNVLLDQVTSQIDVDAAAVLLLNPHNQTLEHNARRGFYTNSLQHTHLRLGEGYAGRAALERRIVHVPNLNEVEDAFIRAPLIATEGFITYYALPLIAKGKVVGVLEAFHRVLLEMDPERLEFMEALAMQAAIAVDNASLFDDLQRSNVDLMLAYDATLEGWSRAMDLRDEETEGHTQRVTEMTLRLARAIGMSDEELVHVRRGALLHDMGKMGIPDSILLKPGALTEEEWEVMRQHPFFAYEMLSPIAYLRPALDIPYCHHEKWDGTGYPRGLKGEHIPLAARVFAVADVWDALRSDRPYRKAWPEEKVRKHIQAGGGTHFDPQVVEAFLALVAGGE